MSFGIALSGGGAKGAAHIGVLAALHENNLLPDSIAGTSMGGIIAALYALGYSPKELTDIAIAFSKCYRYYLDPPYSSYLLSVFEFIFKTSLSIPGLIKGNKIEKYFTTLTKNKNISEVRMPLIISAVDLISGKTIVYSNILPKINLPDVIWEKDAKLHNIMRASSSLPVIFNAKKLNNHILVDGGITQTIPINLMSSTGEKNILAINISQEYEKPKNINIIESTTHSLEIMQRELNKHSLGNETFLISPILPTNAEILDFQRMQQFIKIGYNSTIAVMPELKKLFR